LLFIAGLGATFLIQKRSEHIATPANTSPAQQAAPQQPNEHDSAKRSLDTTTNSVIRKISSKGKRILGTPLTKIEKPQFP